MVFLGACSNNISISRMLSGSSGVGGAGHGCTGITDHAYSFSPMWDRFITTKYARSGLRVGQTYV